MSAPSSPDAPSAEGTARTWREAVRTYLEPAALRMLALGFAAGLPNVLVLGTLSFRLSEAGVNLAVIGFLSWIGLTYAFKWVWAPLVDRLPLPPLTTFLGRRRGWLFLAQGLVIAGLIGMAFLDPQTQLRALIACALLAAFGSATQDIALDAFRIESATADKQAALAATYQTGYRLAMLWAGAGTLKLAAWAELTGATGYQNAGWKAAYLIMAASMGVGVLTVLLSPEPLHRAMTTPRHAQRWLKEALIAPFADFIDRYRWHAVLILALIAVYRISDVVMGVMAGAFYQQMGFTKDEVADISKGFGVVMTLLGGFVGGAMSARLGVMRILLLGAVLSAASNLLFAWLAGRGHDVYGLILVVGADNLAGGLAAAAFIGYLSSLTNISFSATQYALFSSMMLLLPKLIAGYSGVFVVAHGYPAFFTSTALLGLPVVILVVLATRMGRHTGADTSPVEAAVR